MLDADLEVQDAAQEPSRVSSSGFNFRVREILPVQSLEAGAMVSFRWALIEDELSLYFFIQFLII